MAGSTVIWVALAGIVVNAVTAALFARGSRHDLNLRGAFQHMAADALVSLAVMIVGGLILLTGWTVVDPLISLAVAAVILVGSWGLLRDSLSLALYAVPEGVDPAVVQQVLVQQPGSAPFTTCTSGA